MIAYVMILAAVENAFVLNPILVIANAMGQLIPVHVGHVLGNSVDVTVRHAPAISAAATDKKELVHEETNIQNQ